MSVDEPVRTPNIVPRWVLSLAVIDLEAVLCWTRFFDVPFEPERILNGDYFRFAEWPSFHAGEESYAEYVSGHRRLLTAAVVAFQALSDISVFRRDDRREALPGATVESPEHGRN